MSRPNIFLLIISSVTILFSCKTRNNFTTILQTKINSNNLSVDNEFIDLLNEELLANYPNKLLVIKEVEDQLQPSFKNTYDINVRDRGNFEIMITDSIFLVNDKKGRIKDQMKDYLIDLSVRNIKKIGNIDIIMLTPEKEKLTLNTCEKMLSSIREVNDALNVFRDSISRKRYNLKFSNLDLKRKKEIKTEIGKSFALYLFEDLNMFFKPPPPVMFQKRTFKN